MTEDLILSEESVASEEQTVSEAPKPAKKVYVTPQMEIEYFDVEDVIATSGEQANDYENPMYNQDVGGDYDNDPF